MVNFSVDGISTANVRQNGALQDAYPSQEGIAAVKVTSFNNSAEFSQVGDVTFTTKSGTNQYHGSVFEYLQNQALDADPYGFSGKAPKKFNTFGFSLGGPVTHSASYNGHNKTFFFADYEGNRRTTAVAQQFEVPTQAERNGDLSGLDPSLTTPITNISPTANALLTHIPLPNVTGQSGYNYENFQSTPARTDGADIRIDQTITSKQSAYARFSRKNIASDAANPFLPNDVDSIHNRSFLLSHTYAITPKLLNEFRYGFTNVTTSVEFSDSGIGCIKPARSDRREHQPASDDPCISNLQLQRRYRAHADWQGQGRDHAVEDNPVQRQPDPYLRQAHGEGRNRYSPGPVFRSGELRSGICLR